MNDLNLKMSKLNSQQDQGLIDKTIRDNYNQS